MTVDPLDLDKLGAVIEAMTPGDVEQIKRLNYSDVGEILSAARELLRLAREAMTTRRLVQAAVDHVAMNGRDGHWTVEVALTRAVEMYLGHDAREGFDVRAALRRAVDIAEAYRAAKEKSVIRMTMRGATAMSMDPVEQASTETSKANGIEAVGIYAVMARDLVDAIDMINECEDPSTLRLLLDILTAPPTPKTDVKLNALFVPIVERRLAAFVVKP